MQKIENKIKETLEEARKIRDKINYIDRDEVQVMFYASSRGGGHYLNKMDLKELDETVKAMALSKLKASLKKVEANIVKMAKSIGVEKTEEE